MAKKNIQLQHQMFSGPVPGQSLTHAPKSVPWEKPPQFTKLEEAMNFLMTQLVEPMHLKKMLALMESGMPLEAIARTILFTGFTLGKWTPDLGLLMYKPTMLALIAIAHKADMHDTPIILPSSMDKYLKGKTQMTAMVGHFNPQLKKPDAPTTPPAPTPAGFMNRQA